MFGVVVNKQNDYLQRRIRKMHMCLYECGIVLSRYVIGVWFMFCPKVEVNINIPS